MLQWMGGSRRKVATSRKSTYKRQKQYFEQRKQNTAVGGLESYYYDGKKHSRSLDILSLENVPTATQNDTKRLVCARDESENDDAEDDFSFNRQNSHTHPTINAYENPPVDQYQQEQNPLSNCPEKEYSKNVSAGLRDRNETLDDRKNKLDDMKLSTAHEISVMDLLGESVANNDAEESSVHKPEAYVAFSVEGLGKVEIETPVHSPKRPVRYLSNGLSSKRQAMRTFFPSQILNNGLDDVGSLEDVMLEDVDLSPHDSIMEPFFSSREIMNLVGSNNFLNTRKSSPFNWTCCELPGAGCSNELFTGICDDGIWNGRKFLEDNTEYLGEYKSSSKKTLIDQRDFICDDYFDRKEQWMEGYINGRWNLQNKSPSRSSPKKTRTFGMTEDYFPYTKHQMPDEFPNFKVTRKSGYSSIGMDNDVKDTVNRFVDDTRESLSLLSEESSSSTAAKVGAMKKS